MKPLETESRTGRVAAHISIAVVLFLAFGLTGLPRVLWAQGGTPAPDSGASAKKDDGRDNSPKEAAAEEAVPRDEKSQQSYPVRNGTLTYGRTVETEKKTTANGEIEIRRVRAPSYEGDRRVLYENETRTKKLPDGTIERERILKNPNGSGRMVPIEIIREKVRKTNKGTVTERETLRQDYSGRWQPLRKESITETGDKADQKSVKEVQEKNLSGDWKVVSRTVTSEKTAGEEETTHSVRQTPNAYGELSDYEVRDETTSKDGDKETKEVTVRRRDLEDTNNPKFYLVERKKTEETKTAGGKIVKKSETESDLVDNGASRNITPGAPKVVEQETEVETKGADGSIHRVTTIKSRGAADREMRSTGRVVMDRDSRGNVRQIYIPSH